MNEKKRGGSRPGAGRKKGVETEAFYAYLRADQLPTTSAELRAALDEYRAKNMRDELNTCIEMSDTRQKA